MNEWTVKIAAMRKELAQTGAGYWTARETAAKQAQIIRVAEKLTAEVPGYLEHFERREWNLREFPDGAENPAHVYPACLGYMDEYAAVNGYDRYHRILQILDAYRDVIPAPTLAEGLDACRTRPAEGLGMLRMALDGGGSDRVQQAVNAGILRLRVTRQTEPYRCAGDWEHETGLHRSQIKAMPADSAQAADWLNKWPRYDYALLFPADLQYKGPWPPVYQSGTGIAYSGGVGIIAYDGCDAAVKLADLTGCAVAQVRPAMDRADREVYKNG